MTEPNRGPPGWCCRLQRGREHRTVVAAVRSNLPPTRGSCRRRGSPDGTGERADRSPNATERQRPAPSREGRARPGLHRRVPAALASGAGWCWRWTPDFSHDPATCRGCSTRLGTPTCDRLALRRGGGVSDWGAVRRVISRGGSVYSGSSRGRSPRPDRRLQVLPAGVLEAIDLDSVEVRGYAFQVEMTYRAIQLGFSAPRCRSSSATVARRVEDGRHDRRRGDLPLRGCASAPTTSSALSAARGADRRRGLRARPGTG